MRGLFGVADGARTRDTQGLDVKLQYLYVCDSSRRSKRFYLPSSTVGYVLLLTSITYFLAYFYVLLLSATTVLAPSLG